MPKDEIKAFLKEHPQLTNTLFGGILLAGGVVPFGVNHVGSGGP